MDEKLTDQIYSNFNDYDCEVKILSYENWSSPYCEECKSCGESECCPPEKCKYWSQYKRSYDDTLLELDIAHNKIKELEHPSNWCIPVAFSMWFLSVLLKVGDYQIGHWGTLGLCGLSLLRTY